MKEEHTYTDLRSIPAMIAYLSDQMTKDQVRAVEALIEEDEIYAYAIERLHKSLLAGEHAEAGSQQFQDILLDKAQLMAQKRESRKLFSSPYRFYYLAAAVIGLLIAVFIFLPRNPSPALDSSAYLSYYEPRLQQKGGESPEAINQFVQAYSLQDYSAVLDLGQQLLRYSGSVSEREKGEIRLVLASIYLHEDQPKKALELVEALENNPETRIRTEALWYTALGHLQLQDNDRAIQTLKQVKNSGGSSRRSQAIELLAEIEHTR